jgi:hypothetical protein
MMVDIAIQHMAIQIITIVTIDTVARVILNQWGHHGPAMCSPHSFSGLVMGMGQKHSALLFPFFFLVSGQDLHQNQGNFTIPTYLCT